MRSGAKSALFGLCLLLLSSVCAAQSLGDLARQERARRAQSTQRAPVLTNEDLRRETILPVHTAEPVTAKAPVAPTPAPTPTPAVAPQTVEVPLWHTADQPGFSLGEHARAIREQKRQRQEAQAAKAAPRPVSDPAAGPVVQQVARPALADIRTATVARPAVSTIVEKPRMAAAKHAAAATKVRVPRKFRVRHVQEADPNRITVERGDSLWRIAADVYGDGRLWKAIWKANPGIADPNRIYVGQTLRMPSPVQLAQVQDRLAKRAGTVVKAGTVSFGTSMTSPVAEHSAVPLSPRGD